MLVLGGKFDENDNDSDDDNDVDHDDVMMMITYYMQMVF